MGDPGAEVFLMDGCSGPGERFGAGIVAFDEGIDAISDLLGRGEAGALEGGAAEDREPDLDLVHPGGVGRREVEAHVGMTSLMFAQVRGWGFAPHRRAIVSGSFNHPAASWPERRKRPPWPGHRHETSASARPGAARAERK